MTAGVECTRIRRLAAHELRDVVEAERRQHLVRLLLAEQAETSVRGGRRELLAERRSQRLRAGDVVRAVEQHERMPAARPRVGRVNARV